MWAFQILKRGIIDKTRCKPMKNLAKIQMSPKHVLPPCFHQLFDIAPSTISVHFCLSWAIIISLAFSKVRFSSWSSVLNSAKPRSLRFASWPFNFSDAFRGNSARACFAGASSGSLNPGGHSHWKGVWGCAAVMTPFFQASRRSLAHHFTSMHHSCAPCFQFLENFCIFNHVLAKILAL